MDGSDAGAGQGGGDGSVASEFGRVVLQAEQRRKVDGDIDRWGFDDGGALGDQSDEGVGAQGVEG